MNRAGSGLRRRPRHTAGRPFRLPRWLLALVISVLIPAYAIAAVVDPRAPAPAAATADADGLVSTAVDLAGEHSDCSDDAADHVAATVPPLPVQTAAHVRLHLPDAPPRVRTLDTLLRPPSART